MKVVEHPGGHVAVRSHQHLFMLGTSDPCADFQQLKAYVDSQKFNSTTEIMDAMKEMFRDVLQQVMESELDTELGYEKSQRIR